MDRSGLARVGYASNPEFTAEGQAVDNFLNPDRVVVGAWDEPTRALVEDLHVGVHGPVVSMDVESAEMVKLASNAFLMARISLMNEIANVCELTGADIVQAVSPTLLSATTGSGRISCGPDWATADLASPRTPWLSNRWRATPGITSSCSPPSWMGTSPRSGAPYKS